VPVAALAIAAEEYAPTCVLSTWEITNTASFVDVLAWLYLRKPSHAARIINQLAPGPAGFPGRVFQNAIDLLRYDASDIKADLASEDPKSAGKARRILDARISSRDGLLFQHVSWVAATIQFPGATVRSPHVRQADKGFDGLLIEVDSRTTKLARLVLCEDKASTSPRGLVTSKIWPEIKLVVAGEKDLEILDAVTALLDTMHDVDREAVLISTTWERMRQYRIALTAGGDQLRTEGYHHLFTGYDEHIAGALHNRLAEVMPMADVRAYLDNLAAQVTARIEKMAKAYV
jgi:hypothetical protein